LAGFCEHGDEPSDSIKKAGFFDKLRKKSAFQIIFCTMESVVVVVVVLIIYCPSLVTGFLSLGSFRLKAMV
jgi:hypothetical protein